MLVTREQLEAYERRTLAPYAVKSADSRGRVYAEQEPRYRTAFQRDRDRILHTTAFRRLEYKTQVFVNHEGDYYRTRLTHTLEVAQIGRTIARVLGANEDLVEAVCLVHDIGHPPFGHSGEVSLARLMQDHGGFDHNQQALRIVTQLERRYPNFPGLNLTYEVREGLVKHDTDYDVTDAAGYEPELAGTLECQLANLADEIAYNTADLEDGLRSGVLAPEDVATLEVWQTVRRSLAADPDYPIPTDAPLTDLVRARAIRRLIGAEVTDAVYATDQRLRQLGAQSVDDIRRAGKPAATFSPTMTAMNRQLKDFLLQRFYWHWRVVRMAGKAQRILTALFQVYCEDSRQLPPSVQARLARQEEPRERVICDYIAGMTDRFAIQEYQRLFDPEVRV